MRDGSPPAFPAKSIAGAVDSGMTLRDYFAGQFLTTFRMTAPGRPPSELAREAYRVADAMIVERDK